jgi:hypothetical protein
MSKRTRAALRAARRALGELGERGQTTRVPQWARRAVLAYVEAAREEQVAWWQIAEEVGISETALRRWQGKDRDGDLVALLPVEVMAEENAVVEAMPSAGAGTLVSPGGYRVEGLGVEQLAALLARIGQ